MEELSEPDEEIPETGIIINYAIFYPAEKPGSIETFSKNLVDIVKKTSKKPFYLKKVLRGELKGDGQPVNWDPAIKKCAGLHVSAVFLIYMEKSDFHDTEEKFSSSGIFFQTISHTQLERRISYVDMVIELMLTKKER